MARLKCEKCGKTAEIPEHCGKKMTIKKVNNREMFVCWMGHECGAAEIPGHHGFKMKVTED